MSFCKGVQVENNNEPVGILKVHLSPGLLSCTNKASSKTVRNTDYIPSRRKVLIDLGVGWEGLPEHEKDIFLSSLLSRWAHKPRENQGLDSSHERPTYHCVCFYTFWTFIIVLHWLTF